MHVCVCFYGCSLLSDKCASQLEHVIEPYHMRLHGMKMRHDVSHLLTLDQRPPRTFVRIIMK